MPSVRHLIISMTLSPDYDDPVVWCVCKARPSITSQVPRQVPQTLVHHIAQYPVLTTY